MHQSRREPGVTGVLAVFGWAAYLACSWTWCIGMLLPAFLIRDYGLAGFLVFAIPNVVGAAAMGWIIGDNAAEYRRRHSRAIVWFSLITGVFQAFVLGWITHHSPIGIYLATGGVLMAWLTSCLRARPRLVLSAALWLSSCAAGAFALAQGSLGVPEARSNPSGLTWLAPVCVFGFLLCPYLDATFHRARNALATREARGAFTIGFGVMFLAIILMTLGYGCDLATLEHALGGSSPASMALQVHIALQLGFTMGAHWQDVVWIQRQASGSRRSARVALANGLVTAAVFVVAFLGVSRAPWTPPTGGSFTGSEAIYRAFMGFYGLAFPAYVWLVVIASPSGGRGPSRARMRVWAAAVGVATPMFWKGFVDRQEFWLAPGLLIVLAARIALPRKPEVESGDAPPSK